MDYNRIKELLNRKTAIDWMIADQNDEFWLDPILLEDVQVGSSSLLERTKHRIMQFDSAVSIMDRIPKANGMWREGIWLHVTHKILYHCCLVSLIGKTDPHIPNCVYSYRKDTDIEDLTSYPFKKKMLRWKNFANDFRKVAMQDSTQCVLITDLSSYYDHISITKLIARLRLLLQSNATKDDELILELLESLLRLWTKDDFGIPQNYDPSSYFGSLYLYPIDQNMLSKRYTYFRYVDDIRICCQNERQALRALGDLQEELHKDRLYLNTSKTKIVKKGTREFNELIDVTDDCAISEIEMCIRNGVRDDIDRIIPVLKGKIEHHSSMSGDDRKFRAYTNRALDLMDYEEYRDVLSADVRKLVLGKLTSNPDRSDYWTKFLLSVVNDDVVSKVFSLLFDEKVIWNWQRYNLLRLLISNQVSLESVKDQIQKVKDAYGLSPSELERGMLLIIIGKMSSQVMKSDIYPNYYSQQIGYFQQRCLIIAIRDLESRARDAVYDMISKSNNDHRELMDFIKSGRCKNVGIPTRAAKKLPEQPKRLVPITKSGIGMVKGVSTRYRLSTDIYDYE